MQNGFGDMQRAPLRERSQQVEKLASRPLPLPPAKHKNPNGSLNWVSHSLGSGPGRTIIREQGRSRLPFHEAQSLFFARIERELLSQALEALWLAHPAS